MLLKGLKAVPSREIHMSNYVLTNHIVSERSYRVLVLLMKIKTVTWSAGPGRGGLVKGCVETPD